MMADYTPTTDQVRSIFAGNGDWEHRGTAQEREFEFDRWLADHDAQIRAETIREFEDLYFGPGAQTRTWVANAMRNRHGLPPRTAASIDPAKDNVHRDGLHEQDPNWGQD